MGTERNIQFGFQDFHLQTIGIELEFLLIFECHYFIFDAANLYNGPVNDDGSIHDIM